MYFLFVLLILSYINFFLKVTIDGQNVIEKVDIVRIENAAQGSNVPRGTHMDAQVAQNVVFVVSSLIKIDQHL